MDKIPKIVCGACRKHECYTCEDECLEANTADLEVIWEGKYEHKYLLRDLRRVSKGRRVWFT